MARGWLAFAIIAVALPLLAILAAWLAPAYAVGLAMSAITLLLFGFTIGLGFVDE